jgi:hypothetical protein
MAVGSGMLRNSYRRCFMNTKFIRIVTLAAGLVVPAAALAQPVLPSLNSTTDSSTIVARLQQQARMDEFEAKFWSQEPLTQQDFYVQEKEDRQLIARISSGEQISHDEIEQALKSVDTDY